MDTAGGSSQPIYARPAGTNDSGRYLLSPKRAPRERGSFVSAFFLSRLRERRGLPAERCFGNALAECRCGLELAGADALVALVAVGLRHYAERGAGAVEIVDR